MSDASSVDSDDTAALVASLMTKTIAAPPMGEGLAWDDHSGSAKSPASTALRVHTPQTTFSAKNHATTPAATSRSIKKNERDSPSSSVGSEDTAEILRGLGVPSASPVMPAAVVKSPEYDDFILPEDDSSEEDDESRHESLQQPSPNASHVSQIVRLDEDTPDASTHNHHTHHSSFPRPTSRRMTFFSPQAVMSQQPEDINSFSDDEVPRRRKPLLRRPKSFANMPSPSMPPSDWWKQPPPVQPQHAPRPVATRGRQRAPARAKAASHGREYSRRRGGSRGRGGRGGSVGRGGRGRHNNNASQWTASTRHDASLGHIGGAEMSF